MAKKKENSAFLNAAIQEAETGVPEKQKTQLQKYVNEVLALNAGGTVKKDQSGGIIAMKNNSLVDYSETDEFKNFIRALNCVNDIGIPPIKLLYDVLEYYINQRNELTEVKIPALMQEMGLTACQLENGESVSIETDLRIAVINQNAFFKWLRRNKYGDHIKTSLSMADVDYTKELRKYLAKTGVSYETKTDIHWQTRNKIIRDAIADAERKGIPVDTVIPPDDVLSVERVESAKIKGGK